MNDVQKNFRKQMKQGLKELKHRDKEAYYEYIKRNHLDDPESRLISNRKESVKGFFGGLIRFVVASFTLLLILMVGIIFINGPSKKNENAKPVVASNTQKTTTNNITVTTPPNISVQQEVINYLNIIRGFENNINSDSIKKSADVNSVNSKTMTFQEYLNNLEVYKNRLYLNIAEINKTKCPKELERYLSLTNKMYNDLNSAYDLEIQYLKTMDINKNNEAGKIYTVFNAEIGERDKELYSVLDKLNIKHN